MTRARLDIARARLAPLAPIALISALLALIPYPTCLLKLATGVPCPACGMTRASLRLLRGDVLGSLAMHPAALPLAVGLAVAAALALALPAGHPGWDRFVRASVTALALALLAVWCARMAHLLPWV